jgi:hypothetical protein
MTGEMQLEIRNAPRPVKRQLVVNHISKPPFGDIDGGMEELRESDNVIISHNGTEEA